MIVSSSPYHFYTAWCPIDFPLRSAFLDTRPEGLYVKKYLKATLTANKARRLCQQITLLNRLNHPHILPLYAVHENDTHIYLVFEPYTKTLCGENKESTLQHQVIPGILEAIQLLNSKNVFHKNITARTIVYAPQSKCWKLTGFQDAIDYRMHPWSTSEGFRHPLAIPPELFTNTLVESATAGKAAVFALGVLLYDVMVPNKLTKSYGELSPSCRNFIAQCTKSDPSVRWTIENLRSHEWLGEQGVGWTRSDTMHFPELVERFTRGSTSFESVKPSEVTKKKKRWWKPWDKGN